MFMPTHSIWLLNENNEWENCSMTDCNTKSDVRQEVKELVEYYKKKFLKAQYRDKNGKVLYECSIEECMSEEEL